MDFGRDCLVFVKGEEKTDNLADIGTIGASINVKYKHKDLIYSYDTNSATVLSDPKIIDLSEGTVLYYNNIPLSGVSEVYHFAGFYSVYFDEAPRRTYKEATISVEPNVLNEAYELTEDPAIAGLKYVRPDTVLHGYMKEACPPQGTADDKQIFYPYDAGLSQKTAIKNALTNSVSVIESPPGTGRTKTILNLILNLAIRGKTVAVVARNNETLDNIYEKIEKEGFGFLFARPGSDIISGSDESGICGFEKSGAVSISEISSLNQKLEMLLDLEMKEKKLQEKISLYQLELKHFTKTNAGRTAKKFNKLPWKKWDPDKKLRLWADIRLMLAEGKDDAFWPTPRCYFEYGLYDIGEVLRAEDESIYTLQKDYYSGKISELEKELKKIKMSLNNHQFERLLEYQKELSVRYIKNSLYDRYQDQSFNFNTFAYKEVYDEFDVFLKRYPAIMCTVDSLKNSVRRNYVYDFLIMDEASVIDIQTGLKALSCCKKAVFLGDSKQPAPNLMESVISVFGKSAPRTVLREQYLCHPNVIRYFNEKIYGHDLIAYSEPDTTGYDGAYYHRQADRFAEPLRVSLRNEEDLDSYIKYICLEDNAAINKAIPVFNLLYRDYNAVLLPIQKKLLRRKKYRSKVHLYSILEEILKDHRYRHLRFRYDVRLSDLVKNDEADDFIVDFVIYNMFGNKPELIIEIDDKGRETDSLINESGINVLRLNWGDADPEKLIVQNIEDIFFRE